MKKLIAALVLIPLAVGSMSICLAASTASVGIQATVPEQLELVSWIRYAPPGVDPYGTGSGDATSLDFGTLVFDDTYNIWKPTRYFTVFLLASSSGRPYRIQQTNIGFSLGATELNDNLIVTPDYQSGDEIVTGTSQGAIPGGDSYGAKDLALGVNKVIYNGNAGLSRIARAYYGLATGESGEPTGAEPITADQLSGTYSGTITFSAVLQ